MKDHLAGNKASSPKSGYMHLPFLFFALIFLFIGCGPSLPNLPGLQARFTGKETTALITATESCTDDDDNSGKYFTYTFTDSSGEIHHITNNSDTDDCKTNLTLNGELVTIWYQPADPSHFIMADDADFDLAFFTLFSIPLWIWLALCVVSLVRGLSERRRQKPLEMRRETWQ